MLNTQLKEIATGYINNNNHGAIFKNTFVRLSEDLIGYSLILTDFNKMKWI